jgi:hypothetical protein
VSRCAKHASCDYLREVAVRRAHELLVVGAKRDHVLVCREFLEWFEYLRAHIDVSVVRIHSALLRFAIVAAAAAVIEVGNGESWGNKSVAGYVALRFIRKERLRQALQQQ